MNEPPSNVKYNFLFFYGYRPQIPGVLDNSCLSQWYPCLFNQDGRFFTSAEQYMMAKKAQYFGDSNMYRKILCAVHPAATKKYGRMVKGFNDAEWRKINKNIIFDANLLKFSQNDNLKEFLLNTGDTILVEASPYDRIYGIGLSINDPKIYDPACWRGTNLLGQMLMRVRDRLNTRRG